MKITAIIIACILLSACGGTEDLGVMESSMLGREGMLEGVSEPAPPADESSGSECLHIRECIDDCQQWGLKCVTKFANRPQAWRTWCLMTMGHCSDGCWE